MTRREPSAIRVEGDVAFVSLTKGFEAIIDNKDVHIIREHRWRIQTSPKGHIYAARSGPAAGTIILMHRELMRAPKGVIVDHKDGDGLNNRRENIRLATYAQNNANRTYGRQNKLGLKGTCYKNGKYQASIKAHGKTYYLGSFNTVEEAAAAYYGAARIIWGDFASA
jgi:hypothetical protein